MSGLMDPCGHEGCRMVRGNHWSMDGWHAFVEPAPASQGESSHAADCLCLACVPACAPPSKAEFDALPARWRRYVADIETNADPAGTVRENALLKDRVAQLEAAIVIPADPDAAVRALTADWKPYVPESGWPALDSCAEEAFAAGRKEGAREEREACETTARYCTSGAAAADAIASRGQGGDK